MAIDELHQLFLQSCMSRRVFSEKTGQVVYQHCWKLTNGADNDNAPSYSEVVDEVNANIEPFGFQLKRFVDEYSGKAWTAFANTKSDDLAKIATEYTPQEIAYFRTLIKLIIKSGDRYAISSNDAKSAGRNKAVRPELKLAEAEKLLRTFVAKGWLMATSVKVGSKKVDMYQLSARARMELEHYLAEQYPAQMDKDFECKACNEMVMKGVACPQEDCIMRMHDHCARSYFSRNRPICPACKSAWEPEEARVIGPEAREGAGRIVSSESEGEEDAEEGQENGGGSGSEAPASKSKKASKGKEKAKDKGKGKAVASDAEDDHAAMEEDEEEETSRAPAGRSSSRRVPKQKDGLAEESEEEKHVPGATQRDEDDDENEEEQDELAEDDEDEDDAFSARLAASKKKRKAATQSGR
ncbi:hypothetical protein P389DRAFT_36855 [Cystobasidium minutum MCA 4210]|uniref:uncharacterized protein n=1 Tax=Cystobasidium minutum MCA 4210 TaxID=1397322 RepID=UPI0034CD900D|eukprot:jgi/Rhomi1/36855/CE36854_175